MVSFFFFFFKSRSTLMLFGIIMQWTKWFKNRGKGFQIYAIESWRMIPQWRMFQSPTHWPQHMDSRLAQFCILVNACHRKYLGSHFATVKTFDRHTDFYTCQCMKCNRWQAFSFKFHENSEKKNGKVPQIFKTLEYLLKLLTNLLM